MIRPTNSAVTVSDDLRLMLPRRSHRLTPDEAFDLARQLIRRGARAIVDEEVERAPAPRTKRPATGKARAAR